MHKSQQVISYKTDWIISGMQAGAVIRLFYISAHYIVITYFQLTFLGNQTTFLKKKKKT